MTRSPDRPTDDTRSPALAAQAQAVWEQEGGSVLGAARLPDEDRPPHPLPARAAIGIESDDLTRAARVVLTVEGPCRPVVESVALLDGGAQAYPRMLLAIAQARRSIKLEAYAFSLAGIGVEFIEALGEAAARGVRVSAVVDGWGSARSGDAVAAALRDAGCDARVYHRLRGLFVGQWGRNHRKMLLVDDEVAFLDLEALVELDDRGVAKQGEDWIEDHMRRSRMMTSVEAASRARTWLLDPVGRAVARLADAGASMIASQARRSGATDYSISAVRSDGGRPPIDPHSGNER